MTVVRLVRSWAAIVFLGAPFSVFAHGSEAGKTVTLKGEVMDLACYFQHPESGQGPEHAGCAKQCINKGMPAGLKVGGKLYLLLAPGHESVAATVAPLAGQIADITGKLIEREGMTAVVVEKAARAP